MDSAFEKDRPSPVVEASLLLPVTVGCANFMTQLDQNIVITSLPSIARSLGETPTALGLTLTAYVAALIIALPLGGWASERFGARNAYSFAAVVFTVASVLCGLSTSFWQLVAARVLQGFGGALMGTVGQVVILSSFPRHRTLKINTYTALASQVAPMVGPVIGGLLTTYLSWRWIFFVNLPIGICVAALARRRFPTRIADQPKPLDVPGFILIGAGTALIVLGMNAIGERSLPPMAIAGQIACGLMIWAFAIRHSLKAAQPLLDLRLLRIATFRISLLTGGALDTFGLTAVMFLLPLMLQIGFGMTAAQSGSLTFLAAAGSLSVRIFLPALLRRTGFRRMLLRNTPVLATAIACFALLQPSTPVWLIALLIIAFGMLRSLQYGSTGNLAYADVPTDKLSSFSVLYYVLWQLAVAFSIGGTSAMLALFANDQSQLTTNDFHASFLIVAVITLAAIIAYSRLQRNAGQTISGHSAVLPDLA